MLGWRRALGAQVVADDLGAGGPTLAALARTPFDLLKLDRSLVASVDSDERARAVAAAVVALGSTLGLSVIAEGVERVEHGVLVVSVDRLAHVIRVAAARGAHAPVKRLRGASRLRLDGPLPW